MIKGRRSETIRRTVAQQCYARFLIRSWREARGTGEDEGGKDKEEPDDQRGEGKGNGLTKLKIKRKP